MYKKSKGAKPNFSEVALKESKEIRTTPSSPGLGLSERTNAGSKIGSETVRDREFSASSSDPSFSSSHLISRHRRLEAAWLF